MPQIGTHTFPNLKFSRALEVIRRIADDHKGHVAVSTLATALDMAEKGGAFVSLLAGLRDYGLVDGRGDLALSNTAERILFASDPDEGASAKADSFFGVELFRKMGETLDNEIPNEARLRAVVHEITRENLTTISARLPVIRSIWTDGLQTIGTRARRLAERPTQVDLEESNQTDASFPKMSGGDEVVEFRINANYVRVAKNASDIELVVRLLSVIKDQLAVSEARNGTSQQEEATV